MNKKILITGATGFIGSHLLDYLEKNNNSKYSIRILVPPWDNFVNIRPGIIEVCVGDIRNFEDCVRACKDVSYIYHLAALVMDPKYTKSNYYATNVLGTKNILNASGNRLKKIVFFSSVGIYGLPGEVGDIDGWNENRDVFTKEPYGRSKLLGENLVKEFSKKYKFEYSILRPTTVYGPRDKKALLSLVEVINNGLFFIIGRGDNKLDYVYVEDVVRAAFLAMNSRINGEYIIGSKNVCSLNEISKIIAQSLEKRDDFIKLNSFFVYCISYLIQFFFKAFGFNPIIYPKRVKAMSSNFYFDVKKAKKELNFVAKYSFKKGFQFTKSWMYDNNLI